MRRRVAGAAFAFACLSAAIFYAPRAWADPRVRGGFSINGGYFGAVSRDDRANGGAISLAGRLGVQIGDVPNHLLGASGDIV